MELKALREQKHWTQEELAEVSGLSVRTIQRIEAGQEPKGHTAKVLMQALDIKAEETSAHNDELIDYNRAKLINLSTVLVCFIPILNILLPLSLMYFSKQFNKLTKQILSLQILWALTVIVIIISLGFLRRTFDFTLRTTQWILLSLVILNLIVILTNAASLDKKNKLFFSFSFTLI